MKPVIIAIVGPSGCGKTTMAEYIREVFDIQTIVSFTTRPMRDGEMNGREHNFTNDDNIPAKEEMLAYTMFGGYHYWALHSQVPAKGVCTYIIDEKALVVLKETFGERYVVFTVLVKIDSDKLNADEERVKRDNERTILDDEWYDVIIENSGTLDDFKKNILLTIVNQINTNPIFEHIKNR